MSKIMLVDHNEPRRLALVDKIEQVGMTVKAMAEFNVSLKHSQDWIYLIHVGNNGARAQVANLLSDQVAAMLLFTGGSFMSNLKFYQDKHHGTAWQSERTGECYGPVLVDYVNENNTGALMQALKSVADGACRLETDGGTDPSNRFSARFENRRQDLSHDHFKNGFANAMGFEASNIHSQQRHVLLRRATKEPQTWLKMKCIAEQWPDLSKRITGLLEAAQNQPVFADPTANFESLKSQGIEAIAGIGLLMQKFSAPLHEQAVLDDSQIEQFLAMRRYGQSIAQGIVR